MYSIRVGSHFNYEILFRDRIVGMTDWKWRVRRIIKNHQKQQKFLKEINKEYS
jgi:hypothetical protein